MRESAMPLTIRNKLTKNRGDALTAFPEKLQHIALYLRKSRADIEAEARGEGETLSRHRRELLALAKRQGYTIDAVFEELVSGERILDRPEMQKLLHGITEGLYSAVLCMDIDRLGRGNKIDQGLIQEAFQSSHTLIITPQRAYDPLDESDEELLDFQSFMAHRELKIITRRLQRGRHSSVREGKSISSKAPFGYTRQGHTLIPDPETAPIVQQMYSWAAQGMGRVRICHQLEQQGIPSPRGHVHWDHHTVKHILMNPAYLGHLRWNYIRQRRHGGHIKKTILPPEQLIWHKNAHEPIITEDLWRRVQALQTRHAPLGRRKTMANPFAGLILCSICGRPIQRVLGRNHKEHLKCRTFGCPTRSAPLSSVEQAILASFEDLVPRLAARDRKNTQDRREKDLIQAQERTKKSLAQAQGQQARLHDLLEQGAYDIPLFLDRTKVLGSRIEELKRALSDTERRLERFSISREMDAQKITELLSTYRTAPDAATKNHLLRQIVDRIIYRREPDWSEPGHLEIDLVLRWGSSSEV